MLVHGAALDSHVGPQRRHRLFEARCAVDDDQRRRSQSAPDQIVEQRTPGRLAFPAHALDREQHLLTVGAHAKRHEQRDRGRPSVEPDTRDCAVEDQPHDRLFGERTRIPGVPVALRLAPDAADHVLADRPGKHRVQRASHAAGVGPGEISPGEISPGDQGVGGPGAALAGAQRTAPPFARLAVLAGQPSARHGDPRLAKRARQRPLALPVAHADNRRRRLVLAWLAPTLARTRQRLGKFLLQHRLDKAARPSPNPVLDRVEPIIQKQSFGGHSRLLRGSLPHGVVSVPARQRRNHFG